MEKDVVERGSWDFVEIGRETLVMGRCGTRKETLWNGKGTLWNSRELILDTFI